jgi:microcystin-dependent protein
MDRVELYSGGFPVTTTTFNFLQEAYGKAISALTALGGETFILEGVQVVGGNVTDGTIVYNGEYLPFVGGSFNNTVGIYEDVEEVAYNQDNDNDGNLDLKRAYVKRYAKCGTDGLESFNFNLLKRFTPLTGLSMPIGSIMMWSGSVSSIPNGWVLCNGTNGTPDLRGRFIVGAGGAYSVGARGGLDQVTLTKSQMPAHNHSGSTSNAGNHRHTGSTYSGGSHNHTYSKSIKGRGYDTKNDDTPHGGHKNEKTSYAGSHTHTLNMNYAGGHTHSFTTNNQGSNSAHENRPPYYALAFIMFKGL